MNGYDDYEDEESLLNSEIIWFFPNFKDEVIDRYPNGKAITDQLITVNGENTWKIEFYPNGKDYLTAQKISVVITLIKTNAKNLLIETEAECRYRIINKDKNKNFVGKIDKQKFKSYVSANDSSFESSILDDCAKECVIGINISQYQSTTDQNKQVFDKLRTETSRRIDVFHSGVGKTKTDDDILFKKTTAQPLY